MTDTCGPLSGRRILVVEDDFGNAMLLAMFLEENGAEIAGPVGTIQDAMTLLASGERLDGAVLDVNLRGERVFPVADILQDQGVPLVFLTGYDEDATAARYAGVPCLQKPVTNVDRLIQKLLR